MKNTILLFVALGLIASCGNSKDNNTATSNNQIIETKTTASDTPAVEAKMPDVTAKKDIEKGLALVSKSDCSTCHKVTEKMIGPTYTEISNKYSGKSDIEEALAQRIIQGGSGNWGQVPMNPHPNTSVEDAKTMVRYILSLNKQ